MPPLVAAPRGGAAAAAAGGPGGHLGNPSVSAVPPVSGGAAGGKAVPCCRAAACALVGEPPGFRQQGKWGQSRHGHAPGYYPFGYQKGTGMGSHLERHVAVLGLCLACCNQLRSLTSPAATLQPLCGSCTPHHPLPSLPAPNPPFPPSHLPSLPPSHPPHAVPPSSRHPPGEGTQPRYSACCSSAAAGVPGGA